MSNLIIMFIWVAIVMQLTPAGATDAQTKNLYEQAIDYSNKPPQHRERSLAVDLLLQAEKTLEIPAEKADLNLRIARMYWRQFNRETETPDIQSALRHLRIADSFLIQRPSLLSSRITLDMAQVYEEDKNAPEAIRLYKSIITTPLDEIIKNELSDDSLQRMRRFQTKAGIDVEFSAKSQKLMYDERLRRAISPISYKYSNIQSVAARMLAELEFKSGGVAALNALLDEINDSNIKQIIKKEMGERINAVR